MIFNEVYGCYYNAVSKIIENAIDGELTDRKLNDLSKQYAFEESNLTIVPSIKKSTMAINRREHEDTNLE